MGFGLMTAGYIFLCNFTIGSDTMFFDVFPDIAGWILMTLGVMKLSLYTPKMKIAAFPAVALLGISAYTLLYGFNALSFLGENGKSIYEALSYANVVLMLIFHFFMLEGARDIALDTETLPGLASQLRAANIISVIYHVLKLLTPVFYGNTAVYSVVFMIIWLLYVVVLLFTEYLMFTCFRKITVM